MIDCEQWWLFIYCKHKYNVPSLSVYLSLSPPISHFLSVSLPVSLLSPDGSYTEDHSAELHFKSRSSEFDDDFDDEEPLPSIGTCKSLYPFQGTYFLWGYHLTLRWTVTMPTCYWCAAGQNEGTLSMVEGELLSVVEEDKGDGWTRVRRNLEEEGYVPTSYIKVFLDSSAKGAMTYIWPTHDLYMGYTSSTYDLQMSYTCFTHVLNMKLTCPTHFLHMTYMTHTFSTYDLRMIYICPKRVLHMTYIWHEVASCSTVQMLVFNLQINFDMYCDNLQ